MNDKTKRYVAVLRTLHQSKKLNRVSEGAEVQYRRLLEVVDDNGNFDADPGVILGECYAHRLGNGTGLTLDTVKARQQELLDAELVQLYASDTLLHIVNHYTRLRTDGHGADVRFAPFGVQSSPRPESGGTPDGNQPDSTDKTRHRLDKTETRQKQDKREPPAPSADGLALAKLLQSELTRVLPGIPSSKLAGSELDKHLAAWARDFDNFGRIDGVKPDAYRAVISWALADDFWQRQVRSPQSLRTFKKGASAAVWVQFAKANPHQQDELPRGKSVVDLMRERGEVA